MAAAGVSTPVQLFPTFNGPLDSSALEVIGQNHAPLLPGLNTQSMEASRCHEYVAHCEELETEQLPHTVCHCPVDSLQLTVALCVPHVLHVRGEGVEGLEEASQPETFGVPHTRYTSSAFLSFTFCQDTCGAPLAPVAAHDGNFAALSEDI